MSTATEEVRRTAAWSSAGDLAWLDDVLACPACRQKPPGPMQEEFRCRHVQTRFSSRNGIIYPPDLEGPLLPSGQQEAWELVERAAGTYDLADDHLLRIPDDAPTQAVLDWLRQLLRGRGSLRLLELNARRGWAARALSEDGHQVVAGDVLDDSHFGLGCAVRLRDLTGQLFGCVRAGPMALPFLSEAFDCVYGFGLLRQTPDLERVFQEVSRVLRPGGLFLALQEPFRGVLTTQSQRLRDSTFYRLARWWLQGKLPRAANPEMVQLRKWLGTAVHEVRRRVPFCGALGEAAGLQIAILPTAVALSLSSDLRPAAPADGKPPSWLDSLASAYGLDGGRLQALIERARETLGYDLIPDLLSHWLLVGNVDGVLLARKGGDELSPFPALGKGEPEHYRRLDSLLLACAPDGFLPVYGVYPVQIEGQERYCWIQPEAGLLAPPSDSLEITLCAPPRPFCGRPVRIEFRLETERLPIAVIVVRPGKKVTLKLPIPASAPGHASVFVGIRANWGFLPSDFNPAPGCDTRLLAIQLHGIRTGQGRTAAFDASDSNPYIFTNAAGRSGV